jgi:hypothetical protein
MARIGVADGLNNAIFSGAINFTHVIGVGFFGDGEMVDVVGSAMNKIAGATRGFYRDGEHGVHEGENLLMNEETVRILVGITL